MSKKLLKAHQGTIVYDQSGIDTVEADNQVSTDPVPITPVSTTDSAPINQVLPTEQNITASEPLQEAPVAPVSPNWRSAQPLVSELLQEAVAAETPAQRAKTEQEFYGTVAPTVWDEARINRAPKTQQQRTLEDLLRAQYNAQTPTPAQKLAFQKMMDSQVGQQRTTQLRDLGRTTQLRDPKATRSIGWNSVGWNRSPMGNKAYFDRLKAGENVGRMYNPRQQFKKAQFDFLPNPSMKKMIETTLGQHFNKQFNPVGQGNSIGQPMPFNKGGTTMEQQMRMSFMDEGGMKDEGGNLDPVSGNDIPSGSMAKEVRDDIPAMLSEGEFIFPADVTRFIGLEKLMQMRQDAKMGLKKMEMMGQLGDPEDAVLPDDIPFNPADIVIIEEEEIEPKAQGGIIGYQSGTGDTANSGAEGTANNWSSSPDPSQPVYSNINYYAQQQYSDKYIWYTNEAGEKVQILSTWNGQPKEPVPAGYEKMLNPDNTPVEVEPDPKDTDDLEEATPDPVQEGQTDRDDDDDKEPDPMYSSEYWASEMKDGKVIRDKDGNPVTMTKNGYHAILTSANRLGLDPSDYFNMPMSAKFALVSEEMKALFGGTADKQRALDVLEQVKNGTWKGGGGITGLVGGFFDALTGKWSNDGKGDNETTSQILNAGKGKDKKKKEDDPTSPDFSIDEKKQGFQARKHGSYKGVTKSDPYASKAAQFKRDEDDDFRPGQVFETKKQKQDKEDNIRDFGQTSNRGTQSGKSRAKAKALATSKNVSVDTARKLSGAGMEAEDASRDKSSGPYNKGTLVTKRATKKKPTKGKTLVTKRS